MHAKYLEIIFLINSNILISIGYCRFADKIYTPSSDDQFIISLKSSNVNIPSLVFRNLLDDESILS